MASSSTARKKVPTHAEQHRAGRAKKISITVDERVLNEVRRTARMSGTTLSAHISDALARDLRRRALDQLISDYERGHGVITEAELERVRKQWQG